MTSVLKPHLRPASEALQIPPSPPAAPLVISKHHNCSEDYHQSNAGQRSDLQMGALTLTVHSPPTILPQIEMA